MGKAEQCIQSEDIRDVDMNKLTGIGHHFWYGE